MSIQILDEETINQIAAGEVIEDSASCVKELVENALDAGATFISIETKRGGANLISVSDNGLGMSEEALALAILRHATSKLRTVEDLWQLTTLGFRGEALAAIASVSKLKLVSCPVGAKIATEIEVERGEVQAKRRIARGQGTTISVESLFYNTPARAAFQKGASVQNQKIKALLTALALFAQGVGFEWVAEGKKIFSLAAHTSLIERIALLLGDSFATELLPLEFSHGAIHLSGFMGGLLAHRANRLHQHFYINGRSVESKEISLAVTAAYGTRIPERRFPPFVCNLLLSPQEIDVNVHPQKKEIRLKDPTKIGSFFHKAIQTLFAGKEAPKFSPTIPSFSMPPLQRSSVQESAPEPTAATTLALHIHKMIGPYLLAEVDQLYLVDLSRVSQFLFQREIQSRSKKETLLTSQRLLFPFTFNCSLPEAELIEKELALLQKFGFHVRLFGRGSFIIESIPPQYEEEQCKEFLESICAEKKKWSQERFTEILTQKVVRKNYTLEQGRALLLALFALEGPYYLTNGKAVTFALTKENMQKIIP